MKRSRIAASIIVIAVIVSASVASESSWNGHKPSENKREEPSHAPSMNTVKVLDIWGMKESPSGTGITSILINLTSWYNNIDLQKLRIRWKGPTDPKV